MVLLQEWGDHHSAAAADHLQQQLPVRDFTNDIQILFAAMLVAAAAKGLRTL
jgi:hypothetical protein